MSPEAEIATNILVTATLAIDVAIVVLLVALLRWRDAAERFIFSLGLCGPCLAFLASAVALFGSMVYEHVTGFAACPLCWTSRILMIVIALVLLIDRFVPSGSKRWINAGRVAAVLGICVSGYQYVLQWLSLYGTHLPCPAIEGLPSCDRVYFIKFGFVTIPFVAFSTFILILVLLAYRKKSEENKGTDIAA